ncbi:YpiF family protein [Alteribacter aurantiacus]|uniref:YpiF family protein n=1 Tax=Alteribacter aurantiacus TaxID=254410 RepID=UPI0004224226|nr:YpiF family protein [Alteribacter aurantiacus]
MKWTTSDIDMYLKAKEYVDTAIIPLIPLDWEKDQKGAVSKGEFSSILIEEMEKQFKGRLFQLPPFTYLISEHNESKIARLKEWDRHFFDNGFKHIIYVTCDGDWKRVEQQIPDLLIWVPALPLENLDPGYAKEMITGQMKQLLPLITDKWQSEPKERNS